MISWCEENPFARRDFEAAQLRRFRQIIWRTRSDPFAQDSVLLRLALKPLPALVSNGGCGLEKNQALFWLQRIGAPSERVAGENVVVEFRIFATQR